MDFPFINPFQNGGQSHRVLSRLRQGPAENREFIEMGIYRYGARIDDIRGKGFKVISEDCGNGLWLYTLDL